MAKDGEKSNGGTENQDVKDFATIVTPTFTPTISQLDLKSSNMPLAWKNWFAQFKIFLRASSLETQSDQRKVALLLHHMGPDSLEIFNSFNLDLDTVKFDELVSELKAYFLPKVNIAMERHKFFTRTQQMGESIHEYVTALKNLSLSCDFNDLREDLVRDIFVCGLNNNWSKIKERLLNEGDIKLEKALEIAKNIEITKDHTNQLQIKSSSSNAINIINRYPAKNHSSNHTKGHKNYNSHFQNNKKSNQATSQYNNKPKTNLSHSTTNKICSRCGEIHRYRCPAIGVTCNTCKHKNHFSKMCRYNKSTMHKNVYVRNVDADYQSESDDDSKQLFLGMLKQNITTEKNSWIILLKINGQAIHSQIDTGAQANVMSLQQFNKIRCASTELKQSLTRIMTFSGERLPVIGSSMLMCDYNGQQFSIEFHILDLKCHTVLGLSTCIQLKLINKVDEIKLACINKSSSKNLKCK